MRHAGDERCSSPRVCSHRCALTARCSYPARVTDSSFWYLLFRAQLAQSSLGSRASSREPATAKEAAAEAARAGAKAAKAAAKEVKHAIKAKWNKMQDKEPPPPPPVEELVVEEEPVDDYSYVSIGKRDPFRSFIASEVVVPTGGQVGPLQIHEIDQYELRGVIWNIGEPRAMVEDPEGVGHVVELGTLIGKNWGKVTQIKPNALIITEEYRDPIENELIINEVTMRLPDPSEGEQG